MNIGWLRIGNPIDVNYMDSSVYSLNTGIRLGCWQAFAQLGHKVHVLSYVKPSHRRLFKGGDDGTYSYDWMKGRVHYNISIDPDRLDFVVLEYGPGSTMFSHTPDDEDFVDWLRNKHVGSSGISYWYYLRYLLEYAQGHRLVYFTANGNKQLFLRCPLLRDQIENRDYIVKGEPELADTNIRTIFDGIDWSEYVWECWSNALDTGELVALHSGSAGGGIFSAWYSTPVGYSNIYDPVLPVLRIDAPDSDFMYIGHQRDANRTAKLMKFFGPVADAGCVVDVWGKWDISKFDPRSVSFNGPTECQGVTPILYHDSVATIFVGEKQFERIGTMTPRVMIASRAGCIVYMDDEVNMGEMMVGGKEFLVHDADELLETYDTHCTMSYGRRCELVHKQRSVFRPWKDYVGKIIKGVPDATTVPHWER